MRVGNSLFLSVDHILGKANNEIIFWHHFVFFLTLPFFIIILWSIYISKPNLIKMIYIKVALTLLI